ncbi:hypothetical protein AJ79_09171 [Helicocarpus griseus UAMH5409]|uniref:Aflatoxin regulatory protein domain-containing protein n=1 Tax=Helicocarpus griseus UAMH5409 TaxID=1447875 RepID=A0A2B7WLW2_9EURO|nr:hypothetical protein AJ79_09171 [Helicocarpus griseus UAMH5409]
MEDAHFVSDTSISDFVDMIPNGFDIEDMVSLDRFPGPFTSSSHSGEGPPPSRDSQLQFNDIGVHSPSESDCILPSVLSTNEAMPLSPRGPLNLSEVVGRAQLELCESHQQGFSEARNLISSSGGTTIPSTISHCHCLSRAFSLLEDIESMLRQKKPNAIDAILSVQKRALAHGGRMIECEQCTTLSASMFLLSLLSEKLVILFRKIASSCSTDQQADQNLESTVWSPNPNNGQKKICLGEFEMESVNEWGPVANVLLFMQSKRLLWMLGRLKSLAVKSGWQTHLLIVLEADKHMNSLLRSISADKNMFGTNNNDA